MYRPGCDRSVSNLGGITCLTPIGVLFSLVFTYAGFICLIAGACFCVRLLSLYSMPQHFFLEFPVYVGCTKSGSLFFIFVLVRFGCHLDVSSVLHRAYTCHACTRRRSLNAAEKTAPRPVLCAGVVWGADLVPKVRAAWRDVKRAARPQQP